MSKTTFEDMNANINTGKGGIFYGNTNNRFKIDECTFSKSRSYGSAGFMLVTSNYLYVDKSTFTDIKSQNCIMQVKDSNRLKIYNSKFINY